MLSNEPEVIGQAGSFKLPNADNLFPARDHAVFRAQQIGASVTKGLIKDKPLIVDSSVLA
jgi:hypothetical protein